MDGSSYDNLFYVFGLVTVAAAGDKGRQSISEDLSSHLYNSVGRGDLFRADPHAIKNGLTTPHTLLAVYGLQNFFIPDVSWINNETKSLRQYGRSKEFSVLFKRRAGPETDSTKDAVDVLIDLLTLLFFHPVLVLRRDRFSL